MGHEIYNFGGPFLAHHYCKLSLSDLCKEYMKSFIFIPESMCLKFPTKGIHVKQQCMFSLLHLSSIYFLSTLISFYHHHKTFTKSQELPAKKQYGYNSPLEFISIKSP